MIAIDPSPVLLLTVPFLALVGYITRRGLVRNQFRAPGRWAWVSYPTWSLKWWSATSFNFVMLGAAVLIVCESLFHGAEFFREPVHPMPALTGALIKNVRVQRSPESLADCLSNLDHGQAYELAPDHWRVAVRNGRGSVMAIFEILPDGGRSRLEVYQVWTIAFVTWERCYDPTDDGGFASPYLSSQV